jgi:hypothetical protein
MAKRRKPFADDPMMQRLHAVRRKIDQELERLDPKERADYLNRRALAAAAALGYRLVPRGTGTYRLVKRQKRRVERSHA